MFQECAVLTKWLLAVTLFSAYLAGSQYRTVGTPRRSRTLIAPRPGIALALLLLLVLMAMLQWLVPGVLSACRRDAARIAAGEWWRLATALFVQDGGVAGTVFNLAGLLLVGTVAERLWGRRRWLVIFFVGGILSEVVATAWRPIGAGNSVANFSLAGAVTVLCIRRSPTSVFLAALIALAGGAALLLRRDIHGAATMFGAIIGLVLISLDGDRSEQRIREARADGDARP
jgi:membrane associated rhomboid family serine protease